MNKKAQGKFLSVLLWIGVIAYVVSPDPLPGPIDDAVLVVGRYLLSKFTGV